MKKGNKKTKARKKDFIDKLHLREKLSISETIANMLMSEKITMAVIWILIILALIWLLSTLA